MSLKLHTYVPENLFDFGCAGEHPVTIIYSASVEYEGGVKRKRVTIWSVIAKVKFGDLLQQWDITKKINESPADREVWEEELFRDFMGMEERGHDFEEGA